MMNDEGVKDDPRQHGLDLIAAIKKQVLDFSLTGQQSCRDQLIEDIETIERFYQQAFATECLTSQYEAELGNMVRLINSLLDPERASGLQAIQLCREANQKALVNGVHSQNFILGCFRLAHLALFTLGVSLCFASPLICLATNFLAGIFVFAGASVLSLYAYEKMNAASNRILASKSLESYQEHSQRFFSNLHQLHQVNPIRLEQPSPALP